MRTRAASVATSRAWSSSCASEPSSTTPSRRMSGPRVNPWPMSVTRITEKARKITRPRPGNGSPVAVRERQGQRGGQRERSAHAAPAEDEHDPWQAATDRVGQATG